MTEDEVLHGCAILYHTVVQTCIRITPQLFLPSKILPSGLEIFCIVTSATQADMPAVSVLITMVLYRYFQTSDKSMTLPDPHCSLSRLLPSSSIASTNEKVKDLWKNDEHTVGEKELNT